MAFSVAIDGHNFINDLHGNGKDRDYILKHLSLPILHDIIQEQMRSVGMYSHPFIHAEFICSGSGRIGEFKSQPDRMALLTKLKTQSV